MKYHPKVAWLIWGAMVVGLGVMFFARFKTVLSGSMASSDLLMILLLVGLLLAPMFPHVELFGLKLLRDIKSEVDEVKKQVNTLSASIQSQINLNVIQGMTQLPAKPAEDEVQSIAPVKMGVRSPMEHKILRTFWTKQVNRYDEWLNGTVWVFRVNSFYPANPGFLEWRKAATKLILEGLAMETDTGQIYLTPEGFEYCKKHYKEFGDDEYWPEETINEEMLKKVVVAARGKD